MEFHSRTSPHTALAADKRSARRSSVKLNHDAVVFSSLPLEDDYLFEVEITEKDAGSSVRKLPQSDLTKINVGDRVGVLRQSTGAMHLFLNGEDKGEACSGVPFGCYAAVQFWGNCAAISLTSKDNSPVASVPRSSSSRPGMAAPSRFPTLAQAGCAADKTASAARPPPIPPRASKGHWVAQSKLKGGLERMSRDDAESREFREKVRRLERELSIHRERQTRLQQQNAEMNLRLETLMSEVATLKSENLRLKRSNNTKAESIATERGLREQYQALAMDLEQEAEKFLADNDRLQQLSASQAQSFWHTNVQKTAERDRLKAHLERLQSEKNGLLVANESLKRNNEDLTHERGEMLKSFEQIQRQLQSCCSICFDPYSANKPKEILIPCGHCFCGPCVPRFANKPCPICKAAFNSHYRVYDD